MGAGVGCMKSVRGGLFLSTWGDWPSNGAKGDVRKREWKSVFLAVAYPHWVVRLKVHLPTPFKVGEATPNGHQRGGLKFLNLEISPPIIRWR